MSHLSLLRPISISSTKFILSLFTPFYLNYINLRANCHFCPTFIIFEIQLMIIIAFFFCTKIHLVDPLFPKSSSGFIFFINCIDSNKILVIYSELCWIKNRVVFNLFFLKISRDTAWEDFNSLYWCLVSLMIKIQWFVIHMRQDGWYCWVSGKIMISFSKFFLDFYHGNNLSTYHD